MLATGMLTGIRQALASRYPQELVDALLSAYCEIKEKWAIGQHEPSELNGGKLVEASTRMLQFSTNGGIYTPLGNQIRNLAGILQQFEQLPSGSTLESYRIHIPRLLSVIYSIRNKRGVGHLSGDVNPNKADATLIASMADWLIAELYRIAYGCDLDEAQRIVDALAERPLPLIHEMGDMKRVLLPTLSYSEQTLVLLSKAYPDRCLESDLVKWIEPSRPSDFRLRVLRPLHKARLIDYRDRDSALILPPGQRLVINKYPRWLRILTEGGGP